MKKSTLFNVAEILHNLPYEAISATLDATTTGTVIENGRKVLKAGTILAGDTTSIFKDRTKKVKAVATVSTATFIDGILLYDADVTDGDAIVPVVYRGTIREDKLTGGSLADSGKALLPHIQFVKGV